MQIQHWEIYILCLRKNIYNTFKYNFNSKEILCKFISFHINKSAGTDEENNNKNKLCGANFSWGKWNNNYAQKGFSLNEHFMLDGLFNLV